MSDRLDGSTDCLIGTTITKGSIEKILAPLSPNNLSTPKVLIMPTYNDALETYVRETFAQEDEILSSVRQQIAANGLPTITVRPEEGRLLQFLARSATASLALEIGTLGGYSGIWIARGLAPGGRLITLEKELERAELAKESFHRAGLDDRVEIRVGDAHELLPDLSSEGPFDFVFIDAEKEGYPAYLKWTIENLKPGGVLAAHNAFGHGAVADSNDHNQKSEYLRTFNRALAGDDRMISLIIPTGDGMAVGVRTRG